VLVNAGGAMSSGGEKSFRVGATFAF